MIFSSGKAIISATGYLEDLTHTRYTDFLPGKDDFTTSSENFNFASPFNSANLYTMPK
jgi:hypothetical protein